MVFLLSLLLFPSVHQASGLPSVSYPFPTERVILCDQGAMSPEGNSHTYSNTLYALDLATPKESEPSRVLSGGNGYAIVYDECIDHNTKCGSGFGNHVKILTRDGILIMYAHLENVFVKTGDFVKKGQFIGLEGDTGLTGQNNRHLHFSVHSDWRKSGFNFYKDHLGALPNSIPFVMNMCQEKYNTCHKRLVDIRDIKCKRVTGEAEWVQSFEAE